MSNLEREEPENVMGKKTENSYHNLILVETPN